MCGIAGYYAFGNNRPDKEVITRMFVSTQSRGKDASGFAYINQPYGLVTFKQPIKASDMVETNEWRYLGGYVDMPKQLIMHCRQKTQGDAVNNLNNHPVFTKSGWAAIHNGYIRNDNQLFKTLPISRDGHVDSEIIVKLLELGGNWDEGMRHIGDIRGSMAVAAISEKYPDDLLLFRNSNPMVLGHDKDNDILYFASTEETLADGCSVTTVIRGFPAKEKLNSLYMLDMPANTAYLISDNGLAKTWSIPETNKSTGLEFDYSSQFNYQHNSEGYTCCSCGKKRLKSYSWIGGVTYCHDCNGRKQ